MSGQQELRTTPRACERGYAISHSNFLNTLSNNATWFTRFGLAESVDTERFHDAFSYGLHIDKGNHNAHSNENFKAKKILSI